MPTLVYKKSFLLILFFILFPNSCSGADTKLGTFNVKSLSIPKSSAAPHCLATGQLSYGCMSGLSRIGVNVLQTQGGAVK